MTRNIMAIGNDYGCLQIRSYFDRYYWGMEGQYGTNWEKIPEYLYLALEKYADEMEEEDRREREWHERRRIRELANAQHIAGEEE